MASLALDHVLQWPPEVARLLIDKGAEVDKAKDDGATPLLIACWNGHLDVVGLLLDKGADVDKATDRGVTPLFIACESGKFEVARMLIEAGADVEKGNKTTERTHCTSQRLLATMLLWTCCSKTGLS